MPQIDLIPEVYYDPLDPYHWLFDNLPLKNIIGRISLVNDTVDICYDILRGSVGTQGTLANRLSQSINPDGTLRVEAVDASLHDIGAHADGPHGGVEYVRMKKAESDKLALVSDGATDVKLQFDVSPNPILLGSGTVEFQNSVGITWSVSGGNKVKANMSFPAAAAHTHAYDVLPVDSGDHKAFTTTSGSTAFIAGSLRVYVNGMRLTSVSTYVPLGISRTLTLLSVSSTVAANGTFSLSAAITTADIIRIDFDRSFT